MGFEFQDVYYWMYCAIGWLSTQGRVSISGDVTSWIVRVESDADKTWELAGARGDTLAEALCGVVHAIGDRVIA